MNKWEEYQNMNLKLSAEKLKRILNFVKKMDPRVI